MINESHNIRQAVSSRWGMVVGCLWALLVASQLAGCATSQKDQVSAKLNQNDELEARWGVRVESVRLTAAGHLVDFRYRVIDPEKALTLMKRGGEAFLQDETSGEKLPVPVTKVGQLRGTGTQPKDDRVYTVMFNSGNGIIQPGSRVTVVIGDFKAEHLIVE
jgi:hypothetical protein